MSRSNPELYDDMFCSNIPNEQCAKLLSIRNCKEWPEYKNIIFRFPPELIEESLATGVPIRQLVREKQIDYTQYIGELRSYQQVGTAFLHETKHAMLGDGVGLGKTAEISGLINLLYQEKKLVRFIMAVETSALAQTHLELMRFTGLKIVAMPSETPKMKKCIDSINWDMVDGIIIKHSSLRSNCFNNWIGKFIGSGGMNSFFNVFILDESSVIKGDTSQLHNYTENICRMSERTYFMNATPFEKCLMDIYYQFDMMDGNLLPEKSWITKNHCVWTPNRFWKSVRQANGKYKPELQTRWEVSGYKNEQLFKDRLKLAYIGRSKQQVGLDIPHIYKVYTMQPNPDQQSAIARGCRYNEVLNCPSLVTEEKLEFSRAKCPKLDRLCQLAETELSDMKFVVYCFHVEAQYKIKEELEKLGRKCTIINGQDPSGANKDYEKLDRMTKFNEGTYDVMITNAQKSLNLYGADAMVLYSTTATVGRLEQIRGRIDRHVDENRRLFIMLLYEGTGEFDLITETARARGEASRHLILDAETAIDYFLESLNETAEDF